MSKLYKVDSGESCLVCGDELVIHTTVKQDSKPGEYAWMAADGDKVTCVSCGFLAYVSADSESADIAWDETTPHNVKVAEEYERKIGARKAGSTKTEGK